MTKSSFRTKMDKSSSIAVKAIEDEAMSYQFNFGTQTKVRLRKSLAATGNLHLLDTTLLTKAVHDEHGAKLADRYLKKLASLEIGAKFSKNPDYSAYTGFRFITLLDCLHPLRAHTAYDKVVDFKSTLQAMLPNHPSIWLLGAIECEVVNMEKMRDVNSVKTDGETRKLNVLESMLAKMKPNEQNLPSYFLIHFHGIVHCKSEFELDLFDKAIRKKARWSREKRQFQSKMLSTSFNNIVKSTENSLIDIAGYITKGGNEWIKRNNFLRYKLSFDQENYQSMDAWESLHWRKPELRKEHNEEGITDTLSMNTYEITQLALLIDQMMSMNSTRTGYLIDSVAFKKLSTTAAFKNANKRSTLF